MTATDSSTLVAEAPPEANPSQSPDGLAAEQDKHSWARRLRSRLWPFNRGKQSDEVGRSRGERVVRLRRGVGLSLLTVGLCLLVFLGYTFVFTNLQEARSQRQLLNTFTTPQGAVPLSGKQPLLGQPAAVLEIPAIGVDQVVVQGTTSADLMRGPGVMPSTARPGTKGNAVIAGRRFTGGHVFGQLNELVPGDLVRLTTGLGKFRYRVVALRTAEAGQRSPASPTKASQLTLITSRSVSGTSLLYASARLVSAPASATRSRTPPTPAELGLSGDPAAVLPAVLWGLVLAACLAACFVAYSRARERLWTAYLLSTPIVLAVALEWFSFVYRLFPATM